jgi:hypothetical protein
MKKLLIYSCILLTFNLSSCQPEDEVIKMHPDENWFKDYSSLMIEENYTIELLKQGSLTIDELGLIESSGLSGEELIFEYSKYISQDEFVSFKEYNNKLSGLFQNIEFNESERQKVEVINIKSIQLSVLIFSNNTLRSTECEKKAATAASITMAAHSVSIASAAIAAAASGGLLSAAVPAAVAVIVAASLVSYGMTLATCNAAA